MRFYGIAVGAEALSGLALVVAPQMVLRLVLGPELAADGATIGRVLGVGLVAFAASCLRWHDPAGRRAILLYQPLVAAALLAVALFTTLGGPLLWPAILYHIVAGILLARRG